jgi:pimeloyl-ACP methyl ester carboxylesterase
MAHNLDLLSLPLSRINHVLVPDLPGFGGSDDPKEEMGYKAQIDILHGVVKRKGFDRFTLIGISYGGWLTMAWSALYPEDILRAVLLDVPPVSYSESLPPDPRARPQTCPEKFPSREDALEYCAKVYTGFTRDYMVEQLARGDVDEEG